MPAANVGKQCGLVVVISGPSGVGKTTVSRRLIAQYGYEFSVSATTRPPRAGERDDVDYHFLTRERFLDGIRRGEFLEYSEHFDNLYGTPKEPVEQALKEGRTILLAIDVNGARQVMEAIPAPCRYAIFLTAPGRGEQERRLRGRRTDSEAGVQTRLQRGQMEVAQKMLYDVHVENDDVERAAEEIHQHIQKAEARKTDGCGQA